jgi:hypothetical protein
MFLMGLLSFFQVVFIPGFIALKLFKIKPATRLQMLVYAFALSLTVNYLGVFLLTAAGIYKPLTIYIIALLEIAFLVYYIIVNKIGFTLNPTSRTDGYFAGFSRVAASHPFYHTLLYLAALAVLGFFVYIFVSHLGSIFKGWDVVYGWDRFAKDWFANTFPRRTAHYPQLLPANWSLTYMMIGNAGVNVFAKAMMPLFSIASLLLFLDLGLRRKKAVYFVGAVFYGIILRYIYLPGEIARGYADIPVAFFAFLAFYVLLQGDGFLDKKARLLSAAIASAAAVTKQAGIYILVFVLAWNLLHLFKNRKQADQKIFKSILLMLLVVLVVFGSWYIYKEIQISQGLDRSEVHHVTQRIFKGKGYLQRLGDAFAYLYNYKSGLKGKIILLVPLLLFLSLFHAHGRPRRVTLFIVVPFTLAWALFFSYDHRNLTLIFPFAAFSMAFGADFAFDKLKQWWEKRWELKINGWYVAVPVVMLMIVFNFTVFKESRLIDNQLQKQLTDDPALEQLLVYRYEGVGLQGKIYTPYNDLHKHPLLKYYVVRQPGILSVGKLEKVLKKRRIRFLLLHSRLAEEAVLELIDKKVRDGEFIHCFTHKKVWQFILLDSNDIPKKTTKGAKNTKKKKKNREVDK